MRRSISELYESNALIVSRLCRWAIVVQRSVMSKYRLQVGCQSGGHDPAVHTASWLLCHVVQSDAVVDGWHVRIYGHGTARPSRIRSMTGERTSRRRRMAAVARARPAVFDQTPLNTASDRQRSCQRASAGCQRRLGAAYTCTDCDALAPVA